MVVWVSVNMTVSVISSTSRVAGKPVARRTSVSSSTNVSWASWAADRLTVSEMPSPLPDRHGAASRQASNSTARPRARIAPLSSASGMNSSGSTKPRTGCRQRASASTPKVMPVASDRTGW